MNREGMSRRAVLSECALSSLRFPKQHSCGKLRHDSPVVYGVRGHSQDDFRTATLGIAMTLRKAGFNEPSSREATPWPWWMARYVGSNSTPALDDLARSVEGDPPYGGVDRDEAAKVSELIRQYRGPGMASEAAYDAVREKIVGRPAAELALQAFRLNDRVASGQSGAGEGPSIEDVQSGLEVAKQLEHSGMRAYFLGLSAAHAYASGDVHDALAITLQATKLLHGLLEGDDAYSLQAAKTTHLLVTLTVLDGDFDEARKLLPRLGPTATGMFPRELVEVLLAPQAVDRDLATLMQQVSSDLKNRRFYRALEGTLAAERRLLESGDEARLCKLLGDKGEAFWRLGNTKRAIETYQRGIKYCDFVGDSANASRWHQNIGVISRERDDLDGARASFKEGLRTAQLSGDEYLIATALGNTVVVLQKDGRYAEAIELLDETEPAIASNPKHLAVWRHNRLSILQDWSRRLMDEDMVDEAINVLSKGIELADSRTEPKMAVAAEMYGMLGRLLESRNQLGESNKAIRRAIEIYEELGEGGAVGRLREILRIHDDRQGVAIRDADAALKAEPMESLEQYIHSAIASGDRRT